MSNILYFKKGWVKSLQHIRQPLITGFYIETLPSPTCSSLWLIQYPGCKAQAFLPTGVLLLLPKKKLQKVSEPKPPTPWPNTKTFQRGTEEDETLHCTASDKPTSKPPLIVDSSQGSMTFMALHLTYDGQLYGHTWEMSIFWCQQNLIPKINGEYYVLRKYYVFCTILYLEVPQNVHQYIYLCEQLKLSQNRKENYMFCRHQNSCQNIIFHERFWRPTEKNILTINNVFWPSLSSKIYYFVCLQIFHRI